MIASALIHGGALLAVVGIVACARRPWRGGRGAHRHRIGLLAVVAGTGAALLGAGLPARETIVTRPRERLDAVMPRYLFHDRHARAIAATPIEVDRAIRAVTVDEIRFYRTLTWIRRLGRDGPESLIDPPSGVPILTLATRTGFQSLVDDPGREIVLRVAGPASPAARASSRHGAARRFTASAAGRASIAMNFRTVPDGRGGSLLSTETRMYAPGAATRRSLAVYWRVIHPGSALIRRGWLEAIRRRAEAASP